jgi:hypothetical protein
MRNALHKLTAFAVCFFVASGVVLLTQVASTPPVSEVVAPAFSLSEEFEGCWFGEEGGFVRVSGDRITLGEREYLVVPAALSARYSDQLLNTNQSGHRRAGTLDKLVSVKTKALNVISVTSFESESDYLGSNSIGGELNLERVNCDYVENLFLDRVIPAAAAPYQGEWIDDGGSPIHFKDGRLSLRGSTLRYEEIERRTDAWGQRYTLRVKGQLKGYDSEDRIFIVRFGEDGAMYWQRYESPDDFLQNVVTGRGSFWRPAE